MISFVLGTLLGVLVAWRRGTWLDNLLPVTTFFQAAPYFFLAFLAIDAVRDQAGLVPARAAATADTWTSRRWTGPTSATCSTTPSCPR